MGLIGSEYTIAGVHPQPFISDLFAEVFDKFDADGEVDLVMLIRPAEDRDDYDDYEGSSIVVDYIVARSTSNGEETLHLTDSDDPIENLRAVHRWAHEVSAGVEGKAAYMFLHKHPDSNPYPSTKDEYVFDVLNGLDFSAFETDPDTGNQDRLLGFFVVLTREHSIVIGYDRMHAPPKHTRIHDIDAHIAAHLLRRTVLAHRAEEARGETIISETMETRVQRASEIADDIDVLADQWYAATGDDDEQERLFQAMKALMAEAASIAMANIAEYDEQQGTSTLPGMPSFPMPDISNIDPAHLDSIMDALGKALKEAGFEDVEVHPEIGGIGGGFTIPQAGEPIDSQPLGFVPPTIEYVEDAEPPKRPSDIFDLPAIDSLDDETEVRWEN